MDTGETTRPAARRPTQPVSGFDRYFEITARGSTLGREIRGGLATFFTMAYIVVLNPLILGLSTDGDGAQLSQTAVAAATALVAGIMTILMGTVGRFPLALAAGLGVNARVAVFNSVPTQLKAAIGVGIGLFLTLIGLVDAGFVQGGGVSPPLSLGIEGKLLTWPAFVFVVGLLVTIVLVARRVKGAILIGILGSTVLAIIVEAIAKVGASAGGDEPNPSGWALNVPRWPDKVLDVPDLSLVGKFNVLGSWGRAGWLVALMFVFTL